MPQTKTSIGLSAPERSPLSAAPPTKVRDLPKAFLLEQLQLQYKTTPPSNVVETDYTLWECAETGLQFAWPMLPGNAAFYEWVSNFSSYYPGLRWEYKKIDELLQTQNVGKNFKLLDAGCGKGDFLQGLNSLPNQDKFALDMNAPAVAQCRQLGFQAYCGTMDTALAAGFFKAGEFPVVTSFHCLEHVDQPVEFVRSLMAVVAPGGRLFVSTPYSPMSTEADGFDILNHPPHHLTRWNLVAYRKLAEILGLKMRYFAPPGGAFKRALKGFWASQNPPNQPIRSPKLLADLTRQFPVFLHHYRKQVKRGQTHDGIGTDVILVELTRA